MSLIFSFQLLDGGFNHSIMGLLAWLFRLGIKLLCYALMLACCWI